MQAQNKRNKHHGIFILCSVIGSCLLGFIQPAIAGDSNDCNSGNSAEKVYCLDVSAAILKAEITKEKLSKELSKTIDGNNAKTQNRDIGFPVVVSTYGIGDKMTAVLKWEKNGKAMGTMFTHVGSSIPNGWKVVKIHDGQVSIENDGVFQTLLMSNASNSTMVNMEGRSPLEMPEQMPAMPATPPSSTVKPISATVKH